jgi:hypothetical protein
MHHPNSNVKVSKANQQVRFRKGDLYIPMNQEANRFVMEVLEPESNDSYFAWNYFDSILGQKEGYSSYVFEDTAEEYLKTHPELRTKLEERKATDSTFRNNAGAQLDFIFKESPFFEPEYLRYPVFRLVR